MTRADDAAAQRPLLSIVCPVFNEELSIRPFYERLMAALKELQGQVEIEVLFVNNRSTDQTLSRVRELQKTDSRVQLLTLSRNFGYQASITAGMRHAGGDAIVNIDVDGEDPPELIPRFIERWLKGADVVYGIRDKREEFFLMHLARKLFYRFSRGVADHEIVLDMAEFFLVDKRVRDTVLSTRSTFPFVRSQVGYVGFQREGIAYGRQRRLIGKSHYNLFRTFRFGLGGILTSSTAPLRLLAYLGCIVFPLDVVGAIGLLAAGERWNPLWPGRLAAVALLHLGWLVLAFGIGGIYLARVYKDVISLPLYVVDERLTFMKKRDNRS